MTGDKATPAESISDASRALFQPPRTIQTSAALTPAFIDDPSALSIDELEALLRDHHEELRRAFRYLPWGLFAVLGSCIASPFLNLGWVPFGASGFFAAASLFAVLRFNRRFRVEHGLSARAWRQILGAGRNAIRAKRLVPGTRDFRDTSVAMKDVLAAEVRKTLPSSADP